MTAMEMSTEPSVFSWKEIQTRIPGRWSGRRKESQDRRMVDKLNLMKKEKKIETRTEITVGDMVGHKDGGEVPAVDENFGARKMDWMAQSGGPSGRGTDRGRRGRGPGRGSSGRRGGQFSAQGMGTFNPANYAKPTNTDDNYGNSSGNTWNNTGYFEPDDGTRLDFIGVEGSNYPRKFETAPGMIYPGEWRTATEEWGTEDWNEDLSETKIFTTSNVSSAPLPAENVTIIAGQRIDLAVLLGKTPSSVENDSSNLDPSQAPSLAQPLVFSNSKQNAISQPASGNTFSHHIMVSMLGKRFGDVGEAKGGSTTGSQFLEQFKTAQALSQLAAQHLEAPPPPLGI